MRVQSGASKSAPLGLSEDEIDVILQTRVRIFGDDIDSVVE